MNDWSKDINLETIKEYLQECAENDDYHYEQYQIDIVMHEYIRQKQIIERVNNIINELEKWLVEWREMLDYPGFYEEGIIDCINNTLTKLQELKGSDKE